jgi:ABC-type nickel/cobalt efflux system permease component RcnA
MGQKALELGVIMFRLMHGANPSHGSTVAALYSIGSKRPLLGAIVSSGMIAGAHFLSSISVIIAYIYLSITMFVKLPQLYLNYAQLKRSMVIYIVTQNRKYMSMRTGIRV